VVAGNVHRRARAPLRRQNATPNHTVLQLQDGGGGTVAMAEIQGSLG
jgi:hypothetical protein